MTQTIDFRFEIVFLLWVAITLICLAAALVAALAHRRRAAARLMKLLGAGWAVYLSAVLLVAAFTRQHVIDRDHDLCFDDMCFAVVNAQTTSQLSAGSQPVRANGVFYIVTVRITNRAHHRAQSEAGLRAVLWMPDRTFTVSPSGQTAWNAAHPQNAALAARVNPGDEVLSEQVFDLPASPSPVGLAFDHGFTPGYFIIGECPLLHKPTVLRVSTQ